MIKNISDIYFGDKLYDSIEIDRINPTELEKYFPSYKERNLFFDEKNILTIRNKLSIGNVLYNFFINLKDVLKLPLKTDSLQKERNN